jgi:signal transduction histidine kinase
VRERLVAQSEDAEAASRAQKELITNISHDLKTPLATVKAYVEAIQAGICSDLPAVMAYMDVMQAQTNKMAFLIEDLLIHALRDLGQISVEPVEQYSKQLFEVILEPIGHYIQTTGVNYQPPTDIPDVLIRADATRLEQLVSNLVANALKHTGEGDSIRIAIEQQQDVLKVTVSDSGEGISPQDMPFIFERYYQGQAHISYAKKFKDGSGLGLSICKHIVEAHQGFISFRSGKGQGTEFYFTLPLC